MYNANASNVYLMIIRLIVSSFPRTKFCVLGRNFPKINVVKTFVELFSFCFSLQKRLVRAR